MENKTTQEKTYRHDERWHWEDDDPVNGVTMEGGQFFAAGTHIPAQFASMMMDTTGAGRGRRGKRKEQRLEALERRFKRRADKVDIPSKNYVKDEGHGGNTRRQVRVAEMLRLALDGALYCGTEFPKASPISKLRRLQVGFERVEISRDLRHARVFWDAGDAPRKTVNELLTEAAPQLRSLLTKRVYLKFSPELSFGQYDRAREEADQRVDDAIRTLEIQAAEREAAAQQDDPKLEPTDSSNSSSSSSPLGDGIASDEDSYDTPR